MKITAITVYSKTDKIHVFYNNGTVKVKRNNAWSEEMKQFVLLCKKEGKFANYGRQAILTFKRNV